MNEKSHIPHPFELFGVECGKGWYKLIEPIFEYIKNYNKDKKDNEKIVVLQVKEKWGELCIYTNFGTNELHDMMLEAEEKSLSVCEDCGSENDVGMRMNGWMTTMCLDCVKKEAEKNNYTQIWYRNQDKKYLYIHPNGEINEMTQDEIEAFNKF